ncbi:MAG: alpha/beta hydrolase [Hyphomonadaceae bacterium]|nr:alpha/beta hydrolase [Hyphomonadaceae bacterium]
MAIVDGHRVAYQVLGNGKPVVVMISGLGDGMSSFRDVAAEIAEVATVIIYDRAGYGASDAVTGPRDAQAAERELSGLLAQIGVSGPYVLVGHSVGGLFAEYYAAMYPSDVAGLILEDSRPADITRRCEAAGVGMCTAPALAVRFMPNGARGEFAALSQTIAQVEAAGSAPGRDVLVLSRSVEPNAAAFNRIWSVAQNDLALRYPGSRHLVASRSGHYVHQDQAAWFVSSVVAFLGDVTREQAAP